MSYSFPQDANDIETILGSSGLFDQAKALFVGDSDIADPVTRKTNTLKFLLRKMMPVMLCMSWESFVEDLKNKEPNKHSSLFKPTFEIYYNEQIREIFLLRNCIIHKNGKTDDEYGIKSKIKTFPINTEIDFEPDQLSSQFQIFRDAFKQITS